MFEHDNCMGEEGECRTRDVGTNTHLQFGMTLGGEENWLRARIPEPMYVFHFSQPSPDVVDVQMISFSHFALTTKTVLLMPDGAAPAAPASPPCIFCS